MEFSALYSPAHDFLKRHDSKNMLLVAMERHAADHIVRRLGGSQAGIYRYSLRQLIAALAAPILAERGQRPITRLAAEALAAQVIGTTPAPYFQPVANTPGFPAALVETLTRLRLEAEKTASADLRALAEAYEAALEKHGFADTADLCDAAVETITSGRTHALLGLPTLLFDLKTTNVCEAEFLACLGDRAETCETLTPDRAAYGRLPTQLAALQSQLFSENVTAPVLGEGVEFFSASGEALECVEIARRILLSGQSFDECAVLFRNPGRYQPLMEDALRRAHIPSWFTHGSRRPDSAGRAFLALLYCADEGLTASRFAEYLSHGQRAQPLGWERLLVDAAVIGGRDRWERRLVGLASELEVSIEEARTDEERARLLRQIDRLDDLGQFALPIIEQLSELQSPRLWGEWLDAMQELAENVLENAENVLDLLAELEPMRELGPVTLSEVIRLLNQHLGSLRSEPKGNRYGRVFVGSIEEARGLTFETVFVPGMCEGAFPKTLFDDPLVAGNLARLEADERLLLRQACGAATRKVVFSWPRMELSSGRVRVPSFYVLETVRAAMGAAMDRRTLERLAEEPVETRIGWPAPIDPFRAIDETEYDLARLRPVVAGVLTPGLAAYLTKVSPTLARSMRTRWLRWARTWSSLDGLIIQKPDERNPLEKYRLSERAYAPSTLQKFAMCPYRFGLSAILGLTPMKEAAPLERLNRQTRGTLFHEVQKRFVPTLASYPDSAEALQAACVVLDATLEEVCAEYAEELAPAIDQVWKNEIERLRVDLRSWLLTVSSETLWRPMEVERAFEDVVIDGMWRLRGRMDLVEESTDGGLRVTDYKTGPYPKTPPEIIGAGEVLQPLLYAMAAEQLYPEKTVTGGQLFFATLRGGYRSTFIRLDDAARAEAGRVLSTIDNELKRGILRTYPREKACEKCDYIVVCGPYEEERAQRKPVDQMQALIQLRGVK